MMRSSSILQLLAIVAGAVAICMLAPTIPGWMRFVGQISLAIGLVSLGVLLLLRAGLLSFGQGLYYLLGGYAVALASKHFAITDAFLGIALGTGAASAVASMLGLFIARYRGIFFAMLTLALSMIAYGVVLKVGLFGGTDGLNVRAATFLGYAPRAADLQMAMFITTVATSALLVVIALVLSKSRFGKLIDAVHENEIRLEYLGLSVRWTIFAVYVLAGALAGAGGALAAMTARHVEPSFAYWTTSGEFVFVAILSGGGSVLAPFIGALVLEALRSFAASWVPDYWQLVLGTVMLGIVLLLPNGLWSLIGASRNTLGTSAPWRRAARAALAARQGGTP